MQNKTIFVFILVILTFLSTTQLHSQCLTAPTATCIGTEPLVSDGETIHAGTTKWYYGPAANFNLLNMNGGTLIVCGDITISKFSMDSGTIFIQPGARLIIGNGIGSGLVLRGNSYFYNYGRLEVMRNLSLENGWASAAKPNVIINASTASFFKMSNQYFVINNANSWFVNKGKAEFHGLITDPQASARSVCLGSGSETKMTVLYNKVKNSYFAPDPYACVSVSEFSQIWDTLTNNHYINVCLGMTHRTDSTCMPWGCKPSWGQASLFRGCLNCNTIQLLSNSFVSFSALPYNIGNSLNWEMENDLSTGLFYVETSTDGQQFQPIHSLKPESKNNRKKYSYFDAGPSTGWNYYRIKYVDSIYSLSYYTPIVKVNRTQTVSILIYPNPFSDKLHISLFEKYSSIHVSIETVYGLLLSKQHLQQDGRNWQVKFPTHCPAGIYIITINAGGNIWKQKVVKQ